MALFAAPGFAGWHLPFSPALPRAAGTLLSCMARTALLVPPSMSPKGAKGPLDKEMEREAMRVWRGEAENANQGRIIMS